MKKQAKFIVAGLLVFVISSAALTYWLLFRAPATVPERPATKAAAAATPADSVDWNTLYYQQAPGQSSGQHADSFTITNASGN